MTNYLLSLTEEQRLIFVIILSLILTGMLVLYIILNIIKDKYDDKIQKTKSKIIKYIFSQI